MSLANNSLFNTVFDLHTDIYYSRIGFIHVRLGNEIGYNFYHPDLPSNKSYVYVSNHAYESTILKGSLTQCIFREALAKDYRLGSTSVITKDEPLVLLAEVTSCTGSSFVLLKDCIHTFKKVCEPTISMLCIDSMDKKSDMMKPINLSPKKMWDWVFKICGE